jgi:uncharacterized protein YhjY with autotransporter beta-barrel domain
MKLFSGAIFAVAVALFARVASAQTFSDYDGAPTGTLENASQYDNGAPATTTGTSTITGVFQTGFSFGNGAGNGSEIFTINETNPAANTAGLYFYGTGGAGPNGDDGPGTINLNVSPGSVLTINGSTPGVNDFGDFLITYDVITNYSGGDLELTQGVITVGTTLGGNFNGVGTLNITSGTLGYDNQTGGGNDSTMQVGADGGTGIVNQSGSSVVNTGQDFRVGDGGNGTYNLSGTAALNIGTPISGSHPTANLTNYVAYIGANTSNDAANGTEAGTGVLNVTGSSSFNVGPNATLEVGALAFDIGTFTTHATTAGTGTINEGVLGSGTTPTVNLGGVGAYFGTFTGGVGTFNLNSGTLNLSNTTTSFGFATGARGTLNQAGGAVVGAAGTTVNIGDAGTGAYNLSGGTANLADGINVGNQVNSVGTITQTAGSMTVGGAAVVIGGAGTGTYRLSGNSSTAAFNDGLTVSNTMASTGTLTQSAGGLTVAGAAVIGNAGTGTYRISGGTATFNGGLTVGSTGLGTVMQTGGTVTIATGQTLALTQASSTYDLNGGVLEVGTITGAGSLNFSGGGTLQASPGGTLTDGLAGTVAGNTNLDTTNAGITFTGALTGPGGFTINGPNTVTLTAGANTAYTGATIVNGTLQLNAPDATDTFASPISGTGTLNLGNTGTTLRLTGGVDFTGTTTIGTGGTLQVYNGTLGNFGTSNGNLLIGGAGGPASGTVDLTGTNGYTGTTTVDPGFTLLANNFPNSTLITPVTVTGTLGSNGPVGSNMAIGTLGYLDLPEGAQEGTLIVRTNGAVADSYTANKANLYGTILVSGSGSNTYTIVTTAPGNLTTGTLNSTTGPNQLLAVTNSPVLFTATLSEVGTDELVLTTNQALLTQFATNPNQAAVGRALDTVITTPPPGDAAFFQAINGLTAAQIPGFLQQLTPQSYLYMRDIAFENSTVLATKVDGFLGNLRNGFTGLDTSGLSMIAPGMETGLGRSLSSLLAYNNQSIAPNGVNYYPVDPDAPAPVMEPLAPDDSKSISDSPDPSTAPPTVAPAPPTTIFDGKGVGFNEFFSGDIILADLNQNSSGNNIPQAHYTAGDVTAGISFKMTNNLAAGVLFDYNHTDARTDNSGSHIRVDTYSPGLFATFFEKGFYVNALASFGYDNYSNTRNFGFGQATSSPDGQQYVGDLDFGYDFHPDHDHHWTVGPTLGVEYTHLDVGSFNESGGGPADLAVDSQSADSLRSRIGAHVGYQIRAGSILFQPNFTAAWQHEYLDNAFGLSSQLNVPGTPAFTIQGTNPGRDSALIGVGVTAVLDNSMQLYLNYLAQVSADDYFVQSVEGGIKASF